MAVPYPDAMEIRIGIAQSARELSFESPQTPAEVEQTVSSALESGAAFIKLTDDKDRLFIIPTASFAYLEIGSEQTRRVGFVA